MKEFEIELADRNSCSGCAACCDVCPTESIRLDFDTDLFWYPVIHRDTCIQCRRCMAVCSGLNDLTKENDAFVQAYYCAWNKDQVVREHSTSGGVGSALALAAIEHGYYICGAAFDENYNLSHIISNDFDIIEKIRGSKYLQSNTEGRYRKIKLLLENGERVLFFGTPCQVEALLQVLPSNIQKKLLTCGIVCHGVNSPVVWRDFKNDLEGKYHSLLKSYNFRSKCYGWGKLVVEFSLKNGKRVVQPARKNLFHVWFGQHLILRNSCFHCKFRVERRNSDLTIGDFWGIEKVIPEADVRKGGSVLIISSDKGQLFVDRSDSYIFKQMVDVDTTLPVLRGFIKRTESERKFANDLERQQNFIQLYRNHSFRDMKRMFPCPSFVGLAVSFLKSRLKIK